MKSEEQRIREFAYQIWQSEGCPHGEDSRHWEMARKLVEAENGIPTAKPAGRARKTATKPTDATPKAKAAPAGKPRASRAAAKAEVPVAAEPAEAVKKPRKPRVKKDS